MPAVTAAGPRNFYVSGICNPAKVTNPANRPIRIDWFSGISRISRPANTQINRFLLIGGISPSDILEVLSAANLANRANRLAGNGRISSFSKISKGQV